MNIEVPQLWLDDVLIYDIGANKWGNVDCKGEIPSIRDKSTACVLGTKKKYFCLFGGFGPIDEMPSPPEKRAKEEGNEDESEESEEEFDDDEDALLFSWFDDFYAFDTEQNEWFSVAVKNGSQKPLPRCASTMTAISDTEALIFGGRVSDGSRQNDLWHVFFDEDKKEVTYTEIEIKGVLPPNRSFHKAVFVPGNDAMPNSLVVSGGFDGQNYLSDMWKLDITKNVWNALPDIKMGPVAHHCMHFVPETKQICVFGGGSEYDPETQSSGKLCGETVHLFPAY